MELGFALGAQVLVQVVLLRLPASVPKKASKVAPLFLAPGLVQVQAAARPQVQLPSVQKKASKVELLLVALELVRVQVPAKPQGRCLLLALEASQVALVAQQLAQAMPLRESELASRLLKTACWASVPIQVKTLQARQTLMTLKYLQPAQAPPGSLMRLLVSKLSADSSGFRDEDGNGSGQHRRHLHEDTQGFP